MTTTLVTNPTITLKTNKSNAHRITGQYNDIFVVNAARVSFDKESSFDENGQLTVGDQKLLNYLASHSHWTPFSHVRETFAFDEDWLDIDWFIQSINQENMAGMVLAKANVYDKPSWVIRHSLYGWIQLLKLNETEHLFQPIVAKFIQSILSSIYAGSMKAYNMYLDDVEIDGHSGLVEHIPTLDMFEESDPENSPGLYDKPVVEFFQPEKRDYFIDITIREDVSIYVARQRFKHMVGFTFNEVSRRYVDYPPTFFVPDVLRGRAENKKQGSTDSECNQHDIAKASYNTVIDYVDGIYKQLVDKDGDFKVCPEQARGLLPQAMMTSYYATGHLAAWKRLVTQRLDSHAQEEIRDFASIVGEIISDYE